MDIGSVTGEALASVGQQVDVGVLAQLQTMERNVATELFSSLGLGTAIDTYA